MVRGPHDLIDTLCVIKFDFETSWGKLFFTQYIKVSFFS